MTRMLSRLLRLTAVAGTATALLLNAAPAQAAALDTTTEFVAAACYVVELRGVSSAVEAGADRAQVTRNGAVVDNVILGGTESRYYSASMNDVFALVDGGTTTLTYTYIPAACEVGGGAVTVRAVDHCVDTELTFSNPRSTPVTGLKLRRQSDFRTPIDLPEVPVGDSTYSIALNPGEGYSISEYPDHIPGPVLVFTGMRSADLECSADDVKVTVTEHCDEVELKLTNDNEAQVELDYGTAATRQTVTLAAGETKTVTVAATAGDVVTVLLHDAVEPEILTHTVSAESCPGSLPVTGSRTLPIVVASLLLLTAGGALLLVSRRRRAI